MEAIASLGVIVGILLAVALVDRVRSDRIGADRFRPPAAHAFARTARPTPMERLLAKQRRGIRVEAQPRTAAGRAVGLGVAVWSFVQGARYWVPSDHVLEFAKLRGEGLAPDLPRIDDIAP